MNYTTKHIASQWQLLWQLWHDYSRAYRCYSRIRELERLIRWTKSIRNLGPRYAYCRRLEEESLDLLRLQFRHAQLRWWLPFVYQWRMLLIPMPRHWRVGSAARYARTKSRRRARLARLLAISPLSYGRR